MQNKLNLTDDIKIILPKRIKTLDAMRGLAALTVVLGHVLSSIFPTGNFLLDWTPLYIVCSSHEAVIFFFLLSGYVLTHQYNNGKAFNYKFFLIGRILRVYFPYLVALTLSIILFHFFKGDLHTHYNNFIKSQWHFIISGNLILNHIILLGNFKSDTINVVIWSLVHEMRVSLIFPLILLLLKLKWQTVITIALIISIVACFGIVHNINPSQGFNNSYLYTCHYFSIFLIGALLAKFQNRLVNLYTNLSIRLKAALLTLALLVYTLSHLTLNVLNFIHFKETLKYSFLFADWQTVIASCYMMTAAISLAGTKTWLEAKLPLFFGKISYSLYLLHVPVIYVTYKILPHVYFPLALTIGSICSFILAIAFNKAVELPAAAIGRNIIQWLKQGKANLIQEKPAVSSALS